MANETIRDVATGNTKGKKIGSGRIESNPKDENGLPKVRCKSRSRKGGRSCGGARIAPEKGTNGCE